MRIALDTLPGHAGAVVARRPDGTLRRPDDADPAAFPAYRATCSCGWEGTADRPPDDTGRMSATSDWVAHMQPHWAAAPPGWLLNRSDALRQALGDLAGDWPLQALGVLAGIERWQRALTADAVATAREKGASWAEIGAALGITKQSAHERFGGRRTG